MKLPGFSAGGGISGAQSPGDIYVTPTITVGSPLRSSLIDPTLALVIGAALLVVFLFVRGK